MAQCECTHGAGKLTMYTWVHVCTHAGAAFGSTSEPAEVVATSLNPSRCPVMSKSDPITTDAMSTASRELRSRRSIGTGPRPSAQPMAKAAAASARWHSELPGPHCVRALSASARVRPQQCAGQREAADRSCSHECMNIWYGATHAAASAFGVSVAACASCATPWDGTACHREGIWQLAWGM